MDFETLCDFEIEYKAYLTARKRKRKKAKTAEYEANALACTEKLCAMLQLGLYKPSKFETFTVYEPKERLVQAPAFVDKVLLHAIVDNGLYIAITGGFIRHNAASQKGKGMHDALLHLKCCMLNYYRKHGSAEGWVLKGDVRHFFASIPHDKLKEKLKELCIKRGIDVKIYELLCKYIDNSADGLPLGYQTSQLMALLYLDDFDHWVTERHAGLWGYGRYMDDFYAIVETKAEAQALLKEMRAYMAELGLELNEKTAIFPLKNGIDFMGFHTYLTDTGGCVQKLRRSSVQRMRGRLKKWRHELAEGSITPEQIAKKWQGMDAHAAHGDTYALRLKFAQQVGALIGKELKPRRKIRATKAISAQRRAKQMAAASKKAPHIITETLYVYDDPKHCSTYSRIPKGDIKT